MFRETYIKTYFTLWIEISQSARFQHVKILFIYFCHFFPQWKRPFHCDYCNILFKRFLSVGLSMSLDPFLKDILVLLSR